MYPRSAPVKRSLFLSAACTITRYTWQPLVFIVLIVSGGYVFVYLEDPQENVRLQSQKRLQNTEEDILKTFNITKEKLLDYFTERQHFEGLKGRLTPIKAFALCQSIALTTGWGRIVPTTRESKIFFLFYSCISIAITAIILKSMSDILYKIIANIICYVEKRVLKRARHVRLELKSLLACCFLMVIAAVMSSWLQFYFGKSTLDAIYITFQAYTTIGFGDISQFKSLEATASFLFLLGVVELFRILGIVMLATLINSFVRYKIEREQLLKEKLKRASQRVQRKTKKILRKMSMANQSRLKDSDEASDECIRGVAHV